MKIKTIFALSLFLLSVFSKANNLLIQNVTTTSNNTINKTIQVQFDISWDNSWRDSLNWDAAWIFIKFKDASGLWQHAKLNLTGFTSGSGTGNTVKVTSDSVGAWIYRSSLGSGTFNSTSMQIQWNYGRNGLNDPTGLEIRVFAVEMVYVPEGDFNCFGGPNSSSNVSFYYWNSSSGRLNGFFNAPGTNFPIVNTRLSPTLTYNDGTAISLRIKGNAGIDTDINGIVDNISYPTGYFAFYAYKYELTEQQYADFLNTLTSSQVTSIGVAGTGITLTSGQYFSSTPNKACVNSNVNRLLAYADWSGLRPMSFLEFNKASYGPLQPVYNTACCPSPNGYPAWGSNTLPTGWNNTTINTIQNVGSYATSTTSRTQSGASYYGLLDLSGNAKEPVVKLNYFAFTNQNGNGNLNSIGNSDVSSWNTTAMIIYIDQDRNGTWNSTAMGFRYVRSAE